MPIEQKPGDAYVHLPNGHEETGDEVYCFIHDDLVCNSSCIAFDVNHSTSKNRSTCIFINAAKQISTALARLVKLTHPPMPGSNINPPKVQ